MMFLGIWMHGVQCYAYLKVYMWPFKDTAKSQIFDFTINWVHMIRMPTFFAVVLGLPGDSLMALLFSPARDFSSVRKFEPHPTSRFQAVS